MTDNPAHDIHPIRRQEDAEMNYDPSHPANMSTQEIEEELLRRTFDSNHFSEVNFRRIGELEEELERREYDHPSDWGREVAHD